jgi:dihydroorotase/N-acyl-D-amino-acid deacylase
MAQGALGLSTSLQYPPGVFADIEELVALASVAAEAGGIYATHLRSESDGILEALEEAIEVGRRARIPVEVFHLKAAGKPNWGRMADIVERIERARANGVDVAADTYAYPAWFFPLSAFVPPWAQEGGDPMLVKRLRNPETRRRIRAEMESPPVGWDSPWRGLPGPEAVLLCVLENAGLKELQGKRLSEVAQTGGREPIEALLDLLIDDGAQTYVAVFGLAEGDVALALEQPWVSVCTDSEGTSPEGLLGRGHPHPRAYGTLPRILRKYVREEGRLTLEETVRKLTSLPAQRLGLHDRGVLAEGKWADVVVFDPDEIRDRATFERPRQLSIGVKHLLVNGVPVITDGELTGELPGQVLRGRGAISSHP